MRRTLLLKRSIPVLAASSLALLGALTAASLAAADGLPGITTLSTPSVSLPSITTPTLPVTASLPSLTTGTTTTTTDPATSPGTTVAAGTSASDPPAAGGGPVATAIGLRTSSRLLIDHLRLSPTTIRARKQSLSLTLRVRDGAGHLVRGASVSVHSIPTTASRAATSATSIFGTARVRIMTTTHLPASRLLLLLRVSAGPGRVVQVAHVLAVPVHLRH